MGERVLYPQEGKHSIAELVRYASYEYGGGGPDREVASRSIPFVIELAHHKKGTTKRALPACYDNLHVDTNPRLIVCRISPAAWNCHVLACLVLFVSFLCGLFGSYRSTCEGLRWRLPRATTTTTTAMQTGKAGENSARGGARTGGVLCTQRSSADDTKTCCRLSSDRTEQPSSVK